MIVVKLHIKGRHFVKKSLFRSIALVATIFLLVSSVSAQINFGSFGTSYPLTLTAPSGGLVFPAPIEVNSGLHQIVLTDAIIFQIEGLKHLDVGVLITADVLLLKDGLQANSSIPEKRISFTLKAAYSNVGTVQGHTKSGSPVINMSSNMGNVRFPILQRQLTAPGPPPLPAGTFTPADHLDKAEIYVYGDINVGSVEGGDYTGTITITVEYDNPPSEHPAQ